MFKKLIGIFLLIAALVVSGCGDDGEKTPESACLDLADAFGDLCERCESGSYSACRDGFENNIGGGCGAVLDVRNWAELYNICLPWFKGLGCEIFEDENFTLDDSCQGQLLVSG